MGWTGLDGKLTTPSSLMVHVVDIVVWETIGAWEWRIEQTSPAIRHVLSQQIYHIWGHLLIIYQS